MRICKLDATGNIFTILLEDTLFGVASTHSAVSPSSDKLQSQVRLLAASPVWGEKTDGVIYCFRNHRGLVEWVYFNRDGSYASFCGNAARAVSFLFSNERVLSPLGEILATSVQTDFIEIAYTFSFSGWKPVFPSSLGGTSRTPLAWIQAGVPHFLIEGPPDDAEVARSWRFIRGPATLDGQNVTYFWFENQQVFFQTYERGVEGFTQSCGTGALSVSYFLFLKQLRLDLPPLAWSDTKTASKVFAFKEVELPKEVAFPELEGDQGQPNTIQRRKFELLLNSSGGELGVCFEHHESLAAHQSSAEQEFKVRFGGKIKVLQPIQTWKESAT